DHCDPVVRRRRLYRVGRDGCTAADEWPAAAKERVRTPASAAREGGLAATPSVPNSDVQSASKPPDCPEIDGRVRVDVDPGCSECLFGDSARCPRRRSQVLDPFRRTETLSNIVISAPRALCP